MSLLDNLENMDMELDLKKKKQTKEAVLEVKEVKEHESVLDLDEAENNEGDYIEDNCWVMN